MLNIKDFDEKYLGKKFHKLTIIGNGNRSKLSVLIRCECGKEKEMLLKNIIYGHSKSCGCGISLSASIMGRKRVKMTIQTEDGPKTIPELSREYDVPYTRILTRYNRGIRDIQTLVTDKRVGKKKAIDDGRLNGMSQKKASEYFGISKQLVSFRLKRGWRVSS